MIRLNIFYSNTQKDRNRISILLSLNCAEFMQNAKAKRKALFSILKIGYTVILPYRYTDRNSIYV